MLTVSRRLCNLSSIIPAHVLDLLFGFAGSEVLEELLVTVSLSVEENILFTFAATDVNLFEVLKFLPSLIYLRHIFIEWIFLYILDDLVSLRYLVITLFNTFVNHFPRRCLLVKASIVLKRICRSCGQRNSGFLLVNSWF